MTPFETFLIMKRQRELDSILGFECEDELFSEEELMPYDDREADFEFEAD